MFHVLAVILLLAAPAIAPAQRTKATPNPVFEYTGAPIAVPVDCGNEAISTFGLVCPPHSPCPVFLELTSVAFIQGRVFAAGNLHSESVTLYTILLASEDGGLTWTEPAARAPRAGLDQVTFHDKEHGWAAGHVLDGAPKDPFFLITTDGGKNWRKRNIFGDGRTAEIQRFWFESDRSGSVLIDRLRQPETGSRYERHETMTGAESWMIREMSSTPIRPRRRIVSAPSDWRAAPDESSGAWQIQKRESGGWITIAEFLIEPGACAAREEEIAEAPPEPKPAPVSAAATQPAPAGTAGTAAADAGGFDPDNPPVAEGGVLVIRQGPPPLNPTQEVKTAPAEEQEEDKRPTMKKP